MRIDFVCASGLWSILERERERERERGREGERARAKERKRDKVFVCACGEWEEGELKVEGEGSKGRNICSFFMKTKSVTKWKERERGGQGKRERGEEVGVQDRRGKTLGKKGGGGGVRDTHLGL